MIILFLDIDGVLLTKKQELPNHIEKFLPFISENYDCHWLTTHCKGDKNTAAEYLKKYYPADLIPYIEKIKPTNWNTLKTEAIDLKSKFIWLDDFVFESEKKIMVENNCLQSLILIDLNTSPNALIDFIDTAKNTMPLEQMTMMEKRQKLLELLNHRTSQLRLKKLIAKKTATENDKTTAILKGLSEENLDALNRIVDRRLEKIKEEEKRIKNSQPSNASDEKHEAFWLKDKLRHWYLKTPKIKRELVIMFFCCIFLGLFYCILIIYNNYNKSATEDYQKQIQEINEKISNQISYREQLTSSESIIDAELKLDKLNIEKGLIVENAPSDNGNILGNIWIAVSIIIFGITFPGRAFVFLLQRKRELFIRMAKGFAFVVSAIVIIHFIFNPSLHDFEEFIPGESGIAPNINSCTLSKESNYLILSVLKVKCEWPVHENTNRGGTNNIEKKYIGILNNFYLLD